MKLNRAIPADCNERSWVVPKINSPGLNSKEARQVRTTFRSLILWLVGPESLRFLEVAFVYFAASWVGIDIGNTQAQADVIWPANGALLGIILLLPRKQWPGYILYAGFASFLLHYIHSSSFDRSLLFSLANMLEVSTAATLIHSQDEPRPDLSRLRSVLRFFLFGVITAPVVSTLMVGLEEMLLRQNPTLLSLRNWYVGDALGIAIIPPVLLAIHRRNILKLLERRQRLETMLLLAGVTGSAVLIFWQSNYPAAFILFPLLLLIIFRLGISGGAVGIILMAAPAAYFTVSGRGPFSLTPGEPLVVSILMLQLFLCTLSVTVYVVGAALAERQRLHDSLIVSNRQLESQEESLRYLSGRLLHAQDEERKRLASELHDSVSQLHAMALLNLAKVPTEKKRIILTKQIRKAITNSTELMNEASRELRAICYLLHPPLLEELGLKSALNLYVDGFTKRTGIMAYVDVEGDIAHLERDVELTLFRVIQESLTNILWHSGSPTVHIRIRHRDALVLEIEDHGQGPPKELFDDGDGIRQLGVGISGMRERLRQFGGTLKLSPANLKMNSGMIVCATIPHFGRNNV
jgi:signal transduction histidine kinase